MNNYFIGFDTKSVTVPCDSSVKKGDLVCLNNDGSAYTGFEGSEFVGICEQVRGGFATVQLKGYAEYEFKGDQPPTGSVKLLCAKDGTVTFNEGFGRSVIVVEIDAVNNKIGFIL